MLATLSHDCDIKHTCVQQSKVFVCVKAHLIGQNDRAVCKKHVNHGDAQGAKRLVLTLGAAIHRTKYIARIER